MTKITDFLNLSSKDGFARISISVKPAKVQEVAEALDALKRINYQKSASEIICDAIIHAAQAADEREFQRLLSLQVKGILSDSQQQRLEELKEWLRKYKSLPGETLEENELYDATRLLLDILDEQLSK